MTRCQLCGGTRKPRQITHPQKFAGRVTILENVPTEECQQCGDALFHPEVVERVQQLIWSGAAPSRIAQVPVYDLTGAPSVERSELDLTWSSEYPLSKQSIESYVQDSPGVYEILQSDEYSRYLGVTRILKIGMSKVGLRVELENHMHQHTSPDRLARIMDRPGLRVSFRFSALEASAAASVENDLLKQFEDCHWDQPALNSQRGDPRGEDQHYRSR